MEKKQFRFSKRLFTVNGVYNIPGYVICSGHGYAFRTFCCKVCGELFVVELENLHHLNISLASLLNKSLCPTCKAALKDNLVKYPENIYHKGAVLSNAHRQPIGEADVERTEILEVYVLNQIA